MPGKFLYRPDPIFSITKKIKSLKESIEKERL